MKPTLVLSVSLTSFTVCLLFLAYALGMIPDPQAAVAASRSTIANVLAVQILSLEERADVAGVRDAVNGVVDRDPTVAWARVRTVDGRIIAGAGRPGSNAQRASKSASKDDVISIPLTVQGRAAGDIQIGFRRLDEGAGILGLASAMNLLVGFVMVAGFIGYYLILRRALRELDPNRTVPERVKTAFDTLAEGVLITDERGFILLSNQAFGRKILASPDPLIGKDIAKLPWSQEDADEASRERPWEEAIRQKAAVTGRPMTLQGKDGEVRRLLVNTTRIEDGQGSLRGVIATFDDVTVLHNTNTELNASLARMRLMQRTIEETNAQLLQLASNDPLTSCLNRRTFFSRLEEALSESHGTPGPLAFLMFDADHFKSINDRFGHGVGDKVLIGMVDVMKQVCRDRHLIGRYGGEEFCVAVLGPEEEAGALAEAIRLAVQASSWLPEDERVTVSIGLAYASWVSKDIQDLVKRADEALYAAKKGGRNRVVNWRFLPAAQALLAS